MLWREDTGEKGGRKEDTTAWPNFLGDVDS